MKQIHLFFLAGAVAAITACTDGSDLGGTNNVSGLRFLVNNSSQARWQETNTDTRCTPAVVMNGTDGLGDTLYLFCLDTDRITPPTSTPDTRGQRLTGEVFAPDGGIETIGLYAKVGGEVVVPMGTTLNSFAKNGDWYNSQATLSFMSKDCWTNSKTGDFYSYAPTETEAKCISVALNDKGVPTLTFSMQPDEADNKDILTACHLGVTYAEKNSEGVTLEFRHVLSALKFKFATTDAMKVVLEGNTYYLQMKSVQLKNIYAQGSTPLTSDVPTWKQDFVKGECTIGQTNMRQRTDIENDAYVNTDEHCLMVLPQKVPEGAKIVITCDLTKDAEGNEPYMSNLDYTASLEGLTWEPGHSYTYKLSKYASFTEYEFESDDLTAKTYTFPAIGGTEDFNLTSKAITYTSDGTASENAAEWHFEYWDATSGTWMQGLPGGYGLTNGSDIQVRDVAHIPGGVDATYGLVASKRLDGSSSVQYMKGNRYPETGNDYYDLSMRFGSMNTANCYVIDGYGKFKLPLVYGNGILNGATNESAYTETNSNYLVFYNYKDEKITSPYIVDDTGVNLKDLTADVVWMDEAQLLNYSSLKILNDDKGYLAFEVQGECVRPGNAVVAVKDADGTIMWSWHLWFTALPVRRDDAITNLSFKNGSTTYHLGLGRHNLGYRLAEININNTGNLSYQIRAVQNATGQVINASTVVQNEGTTSIKASNVYYQWGRKDPVPGIYLDPTSTTLSLQYMEDDIEKLGYQYNLSMGMTTVATAIQNPGTYFVPGHKYTWMIPHGKTKTSSTSTLGEWSYYYGTARWNPTYAVTAATHYTRPIKSIYDPCPYGYLVASTAARDWAKANPGTTVNVTSGTSSKYYINTNTIVVYNYTSDLSMALTGARHYETGKAITNSVNWYGYVWCSGYIHNSTESSNYNVPVFGPYYSKTYKTIEGGVTNTLSQGGASAVRPMVDRVALGIEGE